MAMSKERKKFLAILRNKYGYISYSPHPYTYPSIYVNNENGEFQIQFDISRPCQDFFPNHGVRLEIFDKDGKCNVKHMSLDELIIIGKIAEQVKREYEEE